MKVLIIEDEYPTRRLLIDLIGEIDSSIRIIGTIDSVEESVQWFRSNPHPEIVFMDIQLSDGISFDILKEVEIECMIVFVTAFNQYAIQAFKVNSLDYLLKPVGIDDLKRALMKYDDYSRKFIQQRNTHVNFDEIISAIKKTETRYRTRFLIQTTDLFMKLEVSTIAFFYSINKITFAVTVAQREFPLDLSLDKLEEQLDPLMFFRANRQVLVNINSILKIHPYFQGKLVIETQPKHTEKITVSKDKAASFKRWIDQ